MVEKVQIVIPDKFYARNIIDGIDTTMGEEIVGSMLQAYLKKDLKRGDPHKSEPDYKIGTEWIEVMDIENEAQKELNYCGEFHKERDAAFILSCIDRALEKKYNKEYNVKAYSIALLCLNYVPFMYEEMGNQVLEYYTNRYIEKYYNSIYEKYITDEKISNIYLLFIAKQRSFEIIDIKKHHDKMPYRINIKCNSSDYPYPYIE